MDKNGQPMTDDAELAKVLEGMQDATASVAAPSEPTVMSFEPTTAVSTDPAAATPSVDVLPPVTDLAAPTPPVVPTPAMAPAVPAGVTTDPALESIKHEALSQLRPLVDKLNLPADERFDTLLLIIRSTDDKSLVQSAYDAAKSITDDAKRAGALLDIVKEIDYFSNPAAGQPQL